MKACDPFQAGCDDQTPCTACRWWYQADEVCDPTCDCWRDTPINNPIPTIDEETV